MVQFASYFSSYKWPYFLTQNLFHDFQKKKHVFPTRITTKSLVLIQRSEVFRVRFFMKSKIWFALGKHKITN